MYRTQRAVDSDSGSASSDEEAADWRRTAKPMPPSATTTDRSRQSGSLGARAKGRSNRRRNDVWGNVIQEQVLMEQMGSGFAVEGLPVDGEDRGVESYDFTRARLDPRPQVEPVPIEGVPEALVKIRKEEENARARKVRERLGVNEAIEKVSPTAEVDEVVKAICTRLNEPKIGLIERVVAVLGQQKALDLLYATENVEANGGLMICNGSRRRTPGGVFLHLLRSNPQISSEDVDSIFASERAESREVERKRKRTELEKKAVRTIRRLEEAILGERPSSSSDSSDSEDRCGFGAKRTKSESAMGEDCPQNSEFPARVLAPDRPPGGGTSDIEEGEIED